MQIPTKTNQFTLYTFLIVTISLLCGNYNMNSVFAQDNMPMDQMGNMTMTMDNSSMPMDQMGNMTSMATSSDFFDRKPIR